MRLDRITSGTAVKLAYDGLDRIAEYDGSNALLRRYVHGPGMDQPIVWYEGSGTTDRRFLSSDERGSVISVTNSSGTVLGLNRFDEFGRPDAANIGAWGYTGQAWIASISAWYYKARIQEPELGRFLQPDPIGYWDSPNLYAYVLNDPVNFVDPLGLSCMQLWQHSWEYEDTDNDGGQDPGEPGVPGSHSVVPFQICIGGSTGLSVGHAPRRAGGGGGRQGSSSEKDAVCYGPSRPSAGQITKANYLALNSFGSQGRVSQLSSQFSRVTVLPNFAREGWIKTGSTHSKAAWEHSLGESGKVIKIYIGDTNFGGINTATITDPTGIFSLHSLKWPLFEMGYPVNTGNADAFLRSEAGC